MTPTDPPSPRDDAVAVVRRLRDAGHVAYFAGGCVRDTLLGHPPKDYDVATDAPPQRVRQLFRNTQAVGAAFGVILVRLGRSTIEVATFRTDGTYTDGRRPDTVTFATAEEDAKRRDFTINGLFMDPLDGDRVIDFVGGVEDLGYGIIAHNIDPTQPHPCIRAIGNPDERFGEDHLRMLRAVRFMAQLPAGMDSDTRWAIGRHAAELPRVSPERIADELRKIFCGPRPARGWRWLVSFGLAEQIFRHLPAGDRTDWDVGRSFLASLPAAIPFGATLAAATLDLQWQREGRPPDVRPWLSKSEIGRVVRAMRQALRISNDEAAELEGTLLGAAVVLADPGPGVAGKKRFLATATAGSVRDLLAAVAAVGPHRDRVLAVQSELTELSRTDIAPPPLVTGDDLTAAGATPGPAFKRALDAAYDAQLEDRAADKAAALALAMDVVRG